MKEFAAVAMQVVLAIGMYSAVMCTVLALRVAVTTGSKDPL